MEWLYHLGVPEDQIQELAANSANTVPVMMPYIDAFFMPRNDTDRPRVVPEGAVNFAFLGQFAETARDTIFTTEYSMRTGMEAVYTLLDVDRGGARGVGQHLRCAGPAGRHGEAPGRQAHHRDGAGAEGEAGPP